jgi:hypothetical protein
MIDAAIHPIIYVRGYAMTQTDIEDTVADPYMGFNIGSCKVRQLWTGAVKKYFFESPLVRLVKEFGYSDVYHEGADVVNDLQQFTTGEEPSRRSVPYRSIVIYRYYEPSSDDLGSGQTPDMARFASNLAKLILALRDRMYPDGSATVVTPAERDAGKPPYSNFRVYLIAHSMGGLVCRAFLQNPAFDPANTRALVDKVFTYATPHNGIEFSLVGNVPGWLKLYGMKTFNRDEIAALLSLNETDRVPNGCVDLVTGFPASRVFNLVGTDPGDYKVAAGLSAAAAGQASDGLVRITNATTRGRDVGGQIERSPNAFVYRSHSGYFGIVNSEEGYQNLVRFLYGDVRADGYLEVEELTLPPAVEAERAAGKEVRASYHFEVTISVRGKTWQLHRRTVNENSAIFRRFDELFPTRDLNSKWVPDRTQSPMLFNVFLDTKQSQQEGTVSFAADICVRASDYEVDKALFFKDHYDGGYLFRDMVTLMAKRTNAELPWAIQYRFASDRGEDWKDASIQEENQRLSFVIPIEQTSPPGIRGRLRVETKFWNDWH